MLFVPGDSVRKFESARKTAADCLILDLEDSVAPDQKASAREIVRGMLTQNDGRQKLYVRVNALDTGLTLGDLAAVVPARPDGIVLPKCEGGADIDKLSLYLDAFEAASGIAPGWAFSYPLGIISIMNRIVVSPRSQEFQASVKHFAPCNPDRAAAESPCRVPRRLHRCEFLCSHGST